MKTRHLLDTSALLAHFRKEQGGATVQALFENQDCCLYISSVTIAEFSRRMRALGAFEEELKASLDFYLSLMDDVVVVDASIAHASDVIQRDATARLPLADSLIAACAFSLDAILVHRDTQMRAIPSPSVRQMDLSKTG